MNKIINAFVLYSKATAGGGAIIRSTSSGGGTTRSTSSGGASTRTSSSGGGTSTSTQSGGGSSQTSSNNGRHSHIMFSGEAETQPASSNQRLYEMRDLNGNYAYGYLPAGNPLIMRTWEESGSHSHSVNIPAHSHSFTVPAHTHTVSIPAHTHDVTIPSHTHDIELPNHTHDVRHEIVELDTLPSKVTIKVDGNVVPHTAISGDRINLVDYMSKDSNGKIKRGRHEVEILPDGLARIEADLIMRVFLQSQLGGVY